MRHLKDRLSYLYVLCVAVCFLSAASGAAAKGNPGIPRPYVLFDAEGSEISFQEMVGSLAEADVVLFGEIHNCSMTHWLELEITKALHQVHGERLMMGAEMFEADNQLILDEYMSGIIRYESFESEARLWPNYHTDYAPFVSYAKEHAIPFIATNVPRRYASMVRYKGLSCLDSLPEAARCYLPPLPIPYRADEAQESMFQMMQMINSESHAVSRLAEAQALKDAAMGWFIACNMKEKFLHFNGNFHSDNKKGIIPYLLHYRPGIKVKTICSVRQATVEELDKENQGRADYYICVPEEMTNTY